MLSGLVCVMKRVSDLVYFERATLLVFIDESDGGDLWGGLFRKQLCRDGVSFAIVDLGCFHPENRILISRLYAFFNGRNAHKNALFLKTNRIICYIWSVVFLAQAGITLWLNTTMLVNFAAIIPILLSIPTFVFTLWFMKWYPVNSAKPK